MPPEDFGAQMLDPREIMILNQLISDADFFAMTNWTANLRRSNGTTTFHRRTSVRSRTLSIVRANKSEEFRPRSR